MFTFQSELRCKTSCELRAHFARTSGPLRANFRPTSCKLRANFARTSGQLRTNFGPTSHKLRANFTQILGQLRTNFGHLRTNQTSGQLCTNRTSGQLCKKFRATSYIRIKFMATLHELRKKTCLNFV